MSTCPLPDSISQTSFSDVLGTLTVGPAGASDELCGVGTSSSTITPGGTPSVVNVPPASVSGPPGPTGPAGQDGCDGIGLEWQGEWSSGVSYTTQELPSAAPTCGGVYGDVVENGGTSYICVYDHTSSASDEPGVGINWTFYWEVLASKGDIGGLNDEDQGLFDTFFDYVKDIPEWGFGDWLQFGAFGVLAGIGLLTFGPILNDIMGFDGVGDGQAAGTNGPYTGTPAYDGTGFNIPTLEEVTEYILEESGLTASEYDLSGLPTKDCEFTRGQVAKAIDVLEMIALSYQVGIVDTGGQIKLVSRSNAPVRTFTDSDIGFTDSKQYTAPFAAKRFQSLDLPKRVELTYFPKDAQYKPFQQFSELQLFTDGKTQRLSVPVSLSDAEAKEITDNIIVNAHLERNPYTITSTYEHADLEPEDIITVPKFGQVRIITIKEQKDGLLELICASAGIAEQPQAIMSGPNVIGYTASTYRGTGLPPVVSPDTETNVTPATVIGYSDSLFLDLPPIDGNDDTFRLFAATHGYGRENWSGAQIYRSIDGGNSYDLIKTVNQEATFGRVASAISNPPVVGSPSNPNYYVWDETTTIQVEIKVGTLESKTHQAVVNGANFAMVGREMIAFRTATLVGTGPDGGNLYDLTGLLRGRQGTEYIFFPLDGTPPHVDDEMFVLIDNTLVELTYPIENRLQPVKYKTVSIGGDITSVTAKDITAVGANHIPWRVAKPTASQQPNNDWIIGWTERPKWKGNLQDYTEAIRDTDWAGWTVVIYDTGAGEPIRTEHSSQPTFTYTEQMQIDDWGSVQGCITVRLYGMSSTVGGGYVREFTCG